MTYKASELIINLMLSEYGYGRDKAREELQAYIEELERKAQEYDALSVLTRYQLPEDPETYGN